MAIEREGGQGRTSAHAAVRGRQEWESPMLTRIGSFGTVMQGGSKMGSEPGTKKMT
jgi:hypothetical protein